MKTINLQIFTDDKDAAKIGKLIGNMSKFSQVIISLGKNTTYDDIAVYPEDYDE